MSCGLSVAILGTGKGRVDVQNQTLEGSVSDNSVVVDMVCGQSIREV